MINILTPLVSLGICVSYEKSWKLLIVCLLMLAYIRTNWQPHEGPHDLDTSFVAVLQYYCLNNTINAEMWDHMDAIKEISCILWLKVLNSMLTAV